MTKQSFSKTTVSNISKFLLDKNFFYFIIPFLILYTLIKITLNIYDWEKNFLHYFSKEIVINSITKLDLFNISKLSIICLISLLIPSILLRFCVGIILIKSQLKVQRFFSFLIILVFIFTTKNDGFSFGVIKNSSEFIINLSKFINILFIGFVVISMMIFYVNINDNIQKRRLRVTVLFLLIISYLFYDWKKTKDFRESTKLNIEKTELIFIIEDIDQNTVNKTKNSEDFNYIKQNFKLSEDNPKMVSNNNISNYYSLLTGLFPFETGVRDEIPSNSYLSFVNDYINKNKRKDKFIYTSNIGNPSSLGSINKNFNGGIICDNSIDSINNYSIIENLNPFLVFMPASMIIKFIPQALCLNSVSNFNENILADLYSGINHNTNDNKIIISFLNNKNREFNIFKIIEKINETLETDKLSIKLLFIDSKSISSTLFHLNKIKNDSVVYKSITEITRGEITNNKSNYTFDYFEENHDISRPKNAKISNNRASVDISETKQQSMNLKRNFICYENNEISLNSIYEKRNNEIPQKIILNILNIILENL